MALSLDGGAATVSGGTLTWSVADQPWQAGDLLMLRIRTGSPASPPTPTAGNGDGAFAIDSAAWTAPRSPSR